MAGSSKVDIMRLSHNVRRNLKREEEESSEGQYGTNNAKQSDLQLVGKNAGVNNQNMAVVGAAALMMVGNSGSNSASGNAKETDNLQIGEDDISLGNNRRMVLNFGDKGEDNDSDYKQNSNPDSGSVTPQHSNAIN